MGTKDRPSAVQWEGSQIKFPTKGQALPLPALSKVLCKQAGKMAQQVRVLTIKPEDPSSMPEPHVVEIERKN